MSTVHRRAAVLIATAAAAVVGLSACSGSATGGSSGTGTRVAGGTIQYAHQQEPACLFGGWIEQSYISYNILDSLLSLDPQGKAVPWLAETWSASKDGREWTFTLKDGVKFTDGTPVDAEAVAYNFDYWLDGGNSTAQVWLAGYYESAEAVDARTLKIHLSRPYPRLPETVSQGYFGIQSKKSLTSRSKEEICAKPIGSGAFTVQSWQRGQQAVLVRNDGYTSWPADARHQGPAIVDKVVWKFVADPTTRVSALRTGQVNAIYDVPAVEWEPLGQQGFQELKYVTRGRPQQLSFNTQVGPFTDEKVRKAFAYSLDRRSIVQAIGQGLIPYEGNGPVSQSTPGYSKQAADLYSLDPAKANALLDEAGWTARDADGTRLKDGKRLEVVLPYGAGSIVNTDGAAILQGVQEQARATGFKVKLIPVSQSELFAGKYGSPQERDLHVGYWTSVTAGILQINWRPSTEKDPNFSNDAFYNSLTLEKFILDGNSAADRAQQEAEYVKAQDHIAEHALSIGLYDRLSTLAVQPSLKDVRQESAQGGPVFHDAYFVE
jgi:peptide/nickel transport system substrate-binding protein